VRLLPSPRRHPPLTSSVPTAAYLARHAGEGESCPSGVGRCQDAFRRRVTKAVAYIRGAGGSSGSTPGKRHRRCKTVRPTLCRSAEEVIPQHPVTARAASGGPEETFVALDSGTPVATASFVASDLVSCRDLTPWLASVFVAPISAAAMKLASYAEWKRQRIPPILKHYGDTPRMPRCCMPNSAGCYSNPFVTEISCNIPFGRPETLPLNGRQALAARLKLSLAKGFIGRIKA
jgi:hypothetical protein